MVTAPLLLITIPLFLFNTNNSERLCWASPKRLTDVRCGLVKHLAAKRLRERWRSTTSPTLVWASSREFFVEDKQTCFRVTCSFRLLLCRTSEDTLRDESIAIGQEARRIIYLPCCWFHSSITFCTWLVK